MEYQLHDTSHWPHVELQGAACQPGYGAAWNAEMTALTASDGLFTVAFDPAGIEETPEDFKQRAIWLKEHRGALAGKCAAMFVVMRDPKERESFAQGDKRSKGLGVPYVPVESFEAARRLSPDYIRQREAS